MGGGTERSPKEFREHWEGLGSPRVLRETGLTLRSPAGMTGAAIIVVENMHGRQGGAGAGPDASPECLAAPASPEQTWPHSGKQLQAAVVCVWMGSLTYHRGPVSSLASVVISSSNHRANGDRLGLG